MLKRLHIVCLQIHDILEKGNYEGKRSVIVEEGRDAQAEHRIFRTVQFSVVVMVDSCHYTFVKTCRKYNTITNPEVNCGLSNNEVSV